MSVDTAAKRHSMMDWGGVPEGIPSPSNENVSWGDEQHLLGSYSGVAYFGTPGGDTIEIEIRTRMLADADIAELVGTRIYPMILPENPTYPAIVYSRVSGGRLRNLAGPVGRGLPRISIASWDTTYVGSKALAQAVQNSLDGFNGVLTNMRALITLENSIDDFDGDAKKYRVMQDYFVSHTEF